MALGLSSFALPHFIFDQPAICILLPVVLGTSVGYAMRPRETQDQYMAIKQPPYRPAPKVFGPVWTLLYAAMGYAAHHAWSTGMHPLASTASKALTQQGAGLYTIQLALNLIWMPLFFRYHRPIEASVDIVALTATTGYLVYVWGQLDAVAGWTLAPYLGWLSFATYLCIGAGWLNDWNFEDKMRPMAEKNTNTRYVDEKQD